MIYLSDVCLGCFSVHLHLHFDHLRRHQPEAARQVSQDRCRTERQCLRNSLYTVHSKNRKANVQNTAKKKREANVTPPKAGCWFSPLYLTDGKCIVSHANSKWTVPKNKGAVPTRGQFISALTVYMIPGTAHGPRQRKQIGSLAFPPSTRLRQTTLRET